MITLCSCSDIGASAALQERRRKKKRWGRNKKTYSDDSALARVQQPHGLVLAGGEDLGAVPVPAGAVDDISVHGVDPHCCLATGHVPQDHHVIAACRGAQTMVM